MNAVLEGIVAVKREEIADGRRRLPEAELRRRCADLPRPRDFRAALVAGPDRIIAEVKRRSPSVPRFRQQRAPAALAALYRDAGAAALSLVTDRAHFGTGPEDIAPMRAAAPLPLVAKDFVLDRWQVLALRAAGADAVLLVARLLDLERLTELRGLAAELGLAALVECHDEADLDLAIVAGADLVGFNNRDLDTFTVSLEVSRRLLPRVPLGCAAVVESGLSGREEIAELQTLGAAAFLVGGALLQSDDPSSVLRALRGAEPDHRREAS